MRQWFTVRQGITDRNGRFSTGSVRGKAKYVIQWERAPYSIRNGSIFQAVTKGPMVKDKAWNHNVKGGDDEYHGMIHTAAHAYFYGNRFGLYPPDWRHVRIAARETDPLGFGSSFSHARAELTYGLAPQIHVKAYRKPSDEVFGTTIHELAHGTHSVVDRISYDSVVRNAFASFSESKRNNSRRLIETWARTVEIMFTVNRYKKKFGISEYQYNYINYQYRKISAENHYTSAGWDMIDNVDQSAYGTGYPVDRVSGYTIKQLELALIGAKSWEQWRDNIKKYENETSRYLNELFANWRD